MADPRILLLAWAGGLALAGSFAAMAGVAGRGFNALIAGTAVLIGVGAVVSLDPIGWLGVAALVVAVLLRPVQAAAIALGTGGVILAVVAAKHGGWLPAVTAAVALGGVMGEMLLGHWYLVDPRLPRWALRSLALAGIIGLVAEGALWWSTGLLPGGGVTAAFWTLHLTSVLLMAGVLGALRYPAYSGVMAATGLSYLAVLTALGTAFLGRALASGTGPFVG